MVNGYLIDCRRSVWDMMVWKDLDENKAEEFIMVEENVEELKDMIARLSQFPPKQRKKQYQSYFLDGEYVAGSRDTLSRMDIMGIPEKMD